MKKNCALALLFFCAPFMCAASGAGLTLTSLEQTPEVGTSVTVEVTAFSDTPVSAIEGEIAYNPKDFSIQSISIENSIMSSWATTPSFDAAKGVIRFSGWVATPFVGERGEILSIHMVPLRVTQTTLEFTSGSMLSAHEAGSNVITTMQSLAFSTTPKNTLSSAPPVIVATSTHVNTALPPEATEVLTPPSQIQEVEHPIDTNAASVFGAVGSIPFIPIVLFFVILVCMAFCIAYALQKMGR